MTIVVDLGITLVYFSIFAILHSVAASNPLKRTVAASFPGFMPYYRLSYNLFALVTLYLFFYLAPKQGYTIYDLPTPFDLIFAFFQLLSFFGLLWCVKYMSGSEFLGISQYFRGKKGIYRPMEELDEISELRVDGPYKYSRHPIYLFSIIFLVFRPQMQVGYLFMTVLIIAYFYIGSWFEEKRLISRFGDDYLNYQKGTGRIFPSLKNVMR